MKDQYSIALIGCGRIASKHLDAINFFHHRVRELFIVDPAPEAHSRTKELVCEQLEDVCFSYSSLSELLSQHSPDIVIITTPPMTHYNLAHEALESGAALLIEKPICLDYKEAYELARLAEDKNTVILVGYIYRYLPFMNIIKNDIDNSLFGELKEARLNMEWGHDQAYYDASHWRGSWSGEGGVLMNQTIHALDLISYLSNRRALSVLSSKLQQRLHRLEAEDTAEAVIQYSQGMVAKIFASTAIVDNDKNPNHKEILFEIKGSSGKVALLRKGDRFSLKYKLNGRPFYPFFHLSYQILRQASKIGFRTLIHKIKNPHLSIYEDLLISLDKGKKPIISATEAAQAVELVSAIYKSALLGSEKITLPLNNFSMMDMENHFNQDTSINHQE